MDRELEEIYLLRDDRPLNDYQPNPVEVDGLIRIPLDDWLQFLFGETDGVTARLVMSASAEELDLHVTMEQLIPAPDRYYHRVAVACHRMLDGERYIVV